MKKADVAIRAPFSVSANKETIIAAEPGQSVWFTACHAEKEGRRLIGTASCSRRGPVKPPSHPKEYYYTEHVFEVHSEDNGRTWEPGQTFFDERDGFSGTRTFLGPIYFLDPDNGRLLALHATAQLDCADGKDAWCGATNVRQRTFRIYYRVSADGGRSWTAARQVIHRGSECDSDHWLPGITYGTNSATFGMSRFAQTADGAIVLPIVRFMTFDNQRPIELCDHRNSKLVAFLRGTWTDSGDDLEWDVSEYLDCPPEERPSGIAEPDLVSLDGNVLFSTMRAMGTEKLNIPSLRMSAKSVNGGKTWTEPKPLTYDDGATVWVPACPSEFFVSPDTGRIYWVANIQDKPVFGAYPRNPLAIAEFDPDRCCLIRESVQVFWRAPANMSATDRRYSNWSSYRDSETGELVLTMPEEWKHSRADYTADAIAIRVRVHES